MSAPLPPSSEPRGLSERAAATRCSSWRQISHQISSAHIGRRICPHVHASAPLSRSSFRQLLSRVSSSPPPFLAPLPHLLAPSPVVREQVADFIAARDGGHRPNPKDIFLTDGASKGVGAITCAFRVQAGPSTRLQRMTCLGTPSSSRPLPSRRRRRRWCRRLPALSGASWPHGRSPRPDPPVPALQRVARPPGGNRRLADAFTVFSCTILTPCSRPSPSGSGASSDGPRLLAGAHAG